MSNEVAIVMGSDSDWPTMSAAAEALDQCGIAYEKDVVSAHRTPEEMIAFAKSAASKGIKVIIAGAGGAAHPLQGRGRVLRHPEPAGHSRHRAGPAGQPGTACPARLHPARPGRGALGGGDVPRQSHHLGVFYKQLDPRGGREPLQRKHRRLSRRHMGTAGRRRGAAGKGLFLV